MIDIHGVFGHAVITRTATIGSCGGPADDRAVSLDDDRGTGACFVREALTDLSSRAGLGLKRGDTFADALVVDARDGVSVIRRSDAHCELRLAHAAILTSARAQPFAQFPMWSATLPCMAAGHAKRGDVDIVFLYVKHLNDLLLVI